MNKKINLAISFLAAFILIAAATGPYFASSAHAQDIQGLLDTVIQAPTAPRSTAHAINTDTRKRRYYFSAYGQT